MKDTDTLKLKGRFRKTKKKKLIYNFNYVMCVQLNQVAGKDDSD